MRSFVPLLILLTGGILCVSCVSCRTTEAPQLLKLEGTRVEEAAKTLGWSTNWARGREIIRELAAFSREELARIKPGAYQGERVAFYGGPAFGGADTGDLQTEGGFYLRLVTPAAKNLHPHSLMWDVLVCGRILVVLPKNKIIVLEVNENDFQVLSSG